MVRTHLTNWIFTQPNIMHKRIPFSSQKVLISSKIQESRVKRFDVDKSVGEKALYNGLANFFFRGFETSVDSQECFDAKTFGAIFIWSSKSCVGHIFLQHCHIFVGHIFLQHSYIFKQICNFVWLLLQRIHLLAPSLPFSLTKLVHKIDVSA